jgi:hypothetical protein
VNGRLDVPVKRLGNLGLNIFGYFVSTGRAWCKGGGGRKGRRAHERAGQHATAPAAAAAAAADGRLDTAIKPARPLHGRSRPLLRRALVCTALLPGTAPVCASSSGSHQALSAFQGTAAYLCRAFRGSKQTLPFCMPEQFYLTLAVSPWQAMTVMLFITKMLP